MEFMMRARNLWSIVSGAELPQNSEHGRQMVAQTFERLSQGLSDEFVHLIQNVDGDVHRARERIQTHMSQAISAYRHQLRRELTTMKLAEGADVQSHITKMRSLAPEIGSHGEQYRIATCEFVDIVFQSLPRSYDTLVTALEKKLTRID